MNKKAIIALSLACICVLLNDAAAATQKTSRKVARAALDQVCPTAKRRQIGAEFFWKNNKPIRANSAINAPVIGQQQVMTLAGQPGRGKGLFGKGGTLYAVNGSSIANMTPSPCRADHCGGRVVSSMQTATARRKAVSLTRNPAGWVKLTGGVCVYIPDIGACFGNGVNKSRPLCDRTLK